MATKQPALAEILTAEALGAFILVFAVIATAVDSRFPFPSGWAGMIIGLALASGIFVAGAVSGGALNPALSVGPYILNLFSRTTPIHYDQIPLYLIGPIIGGVAAAYLYRFMARLPTSP